MSGKKTTPDYVLESSWEVCNKLGGIYTVLSTRAKTQEALLGGNLLFIGPDLWHGRENPLFSEDPDLWPEWVATMAAEGVGLRMGRWNIPGKPKVALVDFQPFFVRKNDLYGQAWRDFGVDSLHAYGDYDESSMFAYAAGLVVEGFWKFFLRDKGARAVYHVNEWMTCLGALYVRKHVPQVATVFTTHATCVGRSIAGNGKPLYQYLHDYDGRQMARELNVESKHSVERQTAMNVDCFTTVSDVTARECAELLDKPCDVVLENGFEPDFVPAAGAAFAARRRQARDTILGVARALTGADMPDDTLIVSTSGRYEYRNKGQDVFMEAMYRSLYDDRLTRPVLAMVQVPAWTAGPRADLQDRLRHPVADGSPLQDPICTHVLREPWNDPVTGFLHNHGMKNQATDRVKVIFVPCYLDGRDGIFESTYYDLLIGSDLAVYPSYYEPWGYTPLEAVAFHVPCVTTSLAGFGAWVNKTKGSDSHLEDGVEVVRRDDYNFDQVANAVRDAIAKMCGMSAKEVDAARKKAAQVAAKAQWKHFIPKYEQAYAFALDRAAQRNA
ncbi:MAG TPA: glycosyl transferase [Prevotellaceae bacterium]|nr:glycosyl transferase [Prevotellaceae bacterium]HBE54928.1 glycosyl transferase [Prevotellaceae bacterium]